MHFNSILLLLMVRLSNFLLKAVSLTTGSVYLYAVPVPDGQVDLMSVASYLSTLIFNIRMSGSIPIQF